MTNGPPASAAGPSRPPQPPQTAQPAAPAPGGAAAPLAAPYYIQAQSGRTPYQQWTTSAWAQQVTAFQNQQAAAAARGPYAAAAAVNAQQAQAQAYARPRYPPQYVAQQPAQSAPNPTPVAAPNVPSPPPSPLTPPPPEYRHWDRVVKDFLLKLGLKQAVKGFETDLLLMNEDFEKMSVPGAINELVEGFSMIQQGSTLPEDNLPLEERKLEYVHSLNPSSPSKITKSISAFIAQNRAKNDASNRAEFLVSLAEKRRKLQEGEEASSCARADARAVDRDVQMKYDIARNTDGPLQRTVKSESSSQIKKEETPLNQRLTDIETHFSVRYVPGPPESFLSRLQFLEEHIIRLEKDYPPWAALHFNQPNRGWPPPPRATPIIVPTHLRAAPPAPIPAAKGGAKVKNAGSTLQRAALEQLAIREAKNEIAGGKPAG
ncbi:hypothetical protein HMN09_00753100 [Mycena chlorophos]|uniref:Uncharacterized protein n=1 Tax=Mycena chlorophos TaxID=658473 RepID=A0A8H6W7N3_MYCCL|nr:hypothetical protein HMN09_00753100 [Mycena chlorophos]